MSASVSLHAAPLPQDQQERARKAPDRRFPAFAAAPPERFAVGEDDQRHGEAFLEGLIGAGLIGP